MKKSLHNKKDFEEVRHRILSLNENAERKWGKMDSAQMLCHCERILEVAVNKINLPKINPIFHFIGICTKVEMRIFNNGIPRNMPTFRKVTVDDRCNFEKSKADLLKMLEKFREVSEADKLPDHHALFGKMSKFDWGFLEYKHLDHHLKQFGI